MKKTLFLLLTVCCCVWAQAAVIVADKGKSDYQIVVPESCGDKTLDEYVTLGGKVIQTAVFKAAGVKLPLVTESKMIPGKPAIYVGNTKAAAKAGKANLEDFPLLMHVDEIICGKKPVNIPWESFTFVDETVN